MGRLGQRSGDDTARTLVQDIQWIPDLVYIVNARGVDQCCTHEQQDATNDEPLSDGSSPQAVKPTLRKLPKAKKRLGPGRARKGGAA